MEFFSVENEKLYFRNDGELLRIMPWGRNSLRVESSLVDAIPEGEIALLEPDAETGRAQAEIRDERHASIQNGNITAELFVQERINYHHTQYLEYAAYHSEKGVISFPFCSASRKNRSHVIFKEIDDKV